MESADFKPVPYTFKLVDYFNKPLLLNENMRQNIVAPCPPFHILLDHTIAVLWLLFSAEESCPLRSVHINWALKFLQGMTNESKTTKYAEDVRKAIECLESALVNFLGEESNVVEPAKPKSLYGEEGAEDGEADEGEDESQEEFRIPKSTPQSMAAPQTGNMYKSVLLNAMLNGMSPHSPTHKVTDEDDDIILLDKLLSEAENGEVKATTESQPSKTAGVPRLREDSTFADAFSYEVDDAVISKASVAVMAEDINYSDDEEVNNFLERKYNEYGRDINKSLKQQDEAKREAAITQEVDKAIRNAPTRSAENPSEPVEAQTKAVQPYNSQRALNSITNYMMVSSVFTDPVFGLRLVNPLVSSNNLIERMKGKTPVSFPTLALHIQRGDLTKDWVIAAVLVSKSPVKQTKTGSPFSVWKLSDLKGDNKIVSLFLFRSAHKKLWKIPTGSVVAILNPSVFDKRHENSEIASLSINTDNKVMILGESKDLGTCKARKKNGEPCTSIVNLSECDYCVYHMKQEYSKMSQRSELQSMNAGRGLNELRNKVLGKSEVFYGGQSFTAVPAKKSAKLAAKDSRRLMSLSEYAVSPNAASVNHASTTKQAKPIPYAERGGPTSKLANNVEANTKQRLKDLERLKILRDESKKFSSQPESKAATPSTTGSAAKSVSNPTLSTSTTPTSKLASMEAKDLERLRISRDQSPQPKSKAASPSTTGSVTKSVSNPTLPTSVSSVPAKYQNREFSFNPHTPQLRRDDFFIEVTVGEKQAGLAKLKAAEVLKKKPIEKVDPNFVKYRGTTEGKRRAVDELNDKFDTESKRQKLEEEQRKNDVKTRTQRIMEATSSHMNLVQSRELQEQEKYFNKLEKKEALEEKMLSTFKVPCKAVICVQCEYMAFSAADRCKQERHPLRVVDAEKRFFQCKDCGNRTATLYKLPKTSCWKCQGSRWERAGMIRERKVDLGREQLSIRGDEETYLGSVASKANINLLVPE